MSNWEIIDNKELIEPEEVAALFASAPWASDRTLEQIERMLDCSDLAVLVLSGGKPVGFARVLTDFIFRAFIEDVIVPPSFQGRGVGRQIVERIETILPGVRLELTTNKFGFWRKMGFAPKDGHMVKELR